MSFLDKIGFKKLKDGLFKTKENLVDRVNRLVNARGVIDDDFLAELEEILISSDIGFDTSETLINNIRERTQRDKYTDQKELNELINDEIKKVFADTTSEFSTFDFDLKQKPYVIMVVGVNGVGKTTSIGKLAYNFKKAGKSVLIGSADTFRAAANDQLEIWAKRAGVDIIQSKSTSDPASVAFETVKSAVAKNIDVVIIDTAGRLHNKSHLMEELKKKNEKEAKGRIILAHLGNGASLAAVKDGKCMDTSTAKGGIVLKINKEMNLPVRFIGVGEQIDDLQVFDSMSFVEAMFEK
jgi:fused signal recognition particle receptor